MKNLTIIALVVWMLILTRTQANLSIGLHYLNMEVMGHEDDLLNLQQQIDRACKRHRHVRPTRIPLKVGQLAPDKN